MKAKIKEKFLEALKSGKYRQGRGLMKYEDAKGNLCHCALGVLCEIYVEATSQRKGKFVKPKFRFSWADNEYIDANGKVHEAKRNI